MPTGTAKSTAAAAAKKAAKPAAPAPRKPTGRSLHIGLNAVSPKAYAGWSGELQACEADATDMTALCKARGMTPTTLLTAKATRAKVLAALRAAAKATQAGDLFVLSFSGHGGQMPDTNRDEPDRQDETWCLFDGQLIDDELYLELSRFVPGSRVLVLSDSCHSGTVNRAAMPQTLAGAVRPRLMPPAVAQRTYTAHQAFYDSLQAAVLKAAGGKAAGGKAAAIDPDAALANANANAAAAAASSLTVSSNRISGTPTRFGPAVILVSGCQDNQTSMDGEHNGAFTEQVLRVWKRGAFKGNYTSFHAKVRAALPATQSPNLFVLGDAAAFLQQVPFSV